MKVYTLKNDGVGYSFPIHKLNDLLNDLRSFDVGDKIEIEIKEMTEKEYNKLPEFDGY